MKVEQDRVVAFGLYTVSDSTLKLSAQLYPLSRRNPRVRLEIGTTTGAGGPAQKVNDLGWSALFRGRRLETAAMFLTGSGTEEGAVRRYPARSVGEREIGHGLFPAARTDRGDRESYVRNCDY
ncbi:MAG: hypothetical protein R2751_15765 [Bacteroidales bacterium]